MPSRKEKPRESIRAMTPLTTQSDLSGLLSQISIDDVREAHAVVQRYLPRTPLMRHPLLCEATGLNLYLKHENHLPTGAFKIRGGLNLMDRLSGDESIQGVATATRGNHGQSIAMAAAEFGMRAVIYVPFGNNPDKNDAIRAYGAELVEYGRDFDEARVECAKVCAEEGLRYVHSANEPHLINGVGTYSLEIVEDLPDVDVVIYPVGGGSAVCGGVTVFRALKPDATIIGVQAANAPSIYNSWLKGEREETESANTIADGLATRVPFELPFEIIKNGVDEMVVVTEDEIRDAIRLILRTTHNVAEGAGAAPVAAARKLQDQLQDKSVVCVLSGGNIDTPTLASILRG